MLASTSIQAFEIALNNNAIVSPVLDAKKAFSRGNTDLVGIQLKDRLLIPGIKANQQERIRKEHRIRPLNRHWRTLENLEQDTRELYKLKRYANRYNLTIMKLMQSEKLEQKTRYRY